MKQDETAHRSRSAGCFSSTVFAARSERVQIDQELVIRELAAIATIDIRKLFAEDGAPRPICDLPEELAAAISSLEMVERRAKDGKGTEFIYKVRLWAR